MRPFETKPTPQTTLTFFLSLSLHCPHPTQRMTARARALYRRLLRQITTLPESVRVCGGVSFLVWACVAPPTSQAHTRSHPPLPSPLTHNKNSNKF